MVRIDKSHRRENFQICITVIEAKHLEPHTNPMIVVRVGNRKKKTAVRKNSDNPYYNEYFIFDLNATMETMLNTRIELSVHLVRRIVRSKFHGNIVFEAATVWDQPDHQYYHKWAMLTNPKDLGAGPKGYVKCNVAIHVKGQKFTLPPETDGDEDIEGNLLLPMGDAKRFAARRHAHYAFTVHRAEDLSGSGTYSVRVSFAGLKGTIKARARTGNPRFDERVVFKEMFPPLSHRARIVLRRRKDVLASCLLNLKNISRSGDYGFLPTFGPSFIHLYADGQPMAEPIYRGRLLLSMKTNIDRVEAGAAGVHLEKAPSILEESLWSTEEYVLVGVLYDVSMINRGFLHRGKAVRFEVSLGNAGNHKHGRHQRVCYDELGQDYVEGPATGCSTKDSQSETLDQYVTSRDRMYNCIPMGAKKPCVFVKSWWPKTEWRLKNTNRLAFIADHFEIELEKVEALAIVMDDKTYEAYNRAVRSLRKHCIEYLASLEKFLTTCCDVEEDEDIDWCLTDLDKHRFNVCKIEVSAVLQAVRTNGELDDNRLVKIAMTHAYRHLTTIRNLSKDPQDSLPDVFLWMLSGSKRLAYTRIPVNRVLFAKTLQNCGLDCGLRRNVFLSRPGRETTGEVCKVDLFLWLGSVSNLPNCWNTIPAGYDKQDTTALTFPRYLVYQESAKFQLRAHIFQGRFDPGMDSSGLLDPLLRVIFQGYTMSTRVMKQTLDAFWDQTLVFPAMEIHGERRHIKSDPPRVVLEALDRDFGNRFEFYGRCVASPVVKLAEERYEPPEFPAQLRWYRFMSWNKADYEVGGACLVALELLEYNKDDLVEPEWEEDPEDVPYRRVPRTIRPRMANYRMEVVFWGIRDFKRVNFLPVNHPKIMVELSGARVESVIMDSARKFSNFRENYVSVDLEMAEDEIYRPPITLKAYDWRGFGYLRWVGVCVVPTLHVFMRRLVPKSEYERAIYKGGGDTQNHVTVPIDLEPRFSKTPSRTDLKGSFRSMNPKMRGVAGHFLDRLLSWKKPLYLDEPTSLLEIDNDEYHDWWGKYFASLEEERYRDRKLVSNSNQKRMATFKVYPSELESQPEFSGFQDCLRSFELKRGKQLGDPADYDEKSFAGKFKGFIAIYRWPHPKGLTCVNLLGRSMSFGLLSDYPSQQPQKLHVRLYAVKAINLRPSDPLSGKSDPYLVLQLGKSRINDRKNYIPNQLNPTFGRVFDFEATFPKDHTLVIQVWDWDAASADDFIGETRVDIESRYYSHHRGQCGLAYHYDVEGYNEWRDREKPSQILGQLCRRFNLPLPRYSADHVTIAGQRFGYPLDHGDEEEREERMALSVLHRWSEFPIVGCALVPEHIERRPLFNPKRPGLEQGRLEMWIDMFPVDELPVKPAVDITPHEPEEYELRVTVWNTEDVTLVDSQFLTGEKCSDIYVKGWLLGEDSQRTDVHYNSLTGEGNFNWRFVFRFTWARGERMMIVKRKSSVFARDATEQRLPGRLYIQVWDSDHFSPDDFLGSLSLDLNNMPRGSHNAQNCTLSILEPSSARFSLFRAQRIRAWWPLTTSNALGRYFDAGKIDMELQLLPLAEAEEHPVGKGREEPDPLPKPNRPDTSFSWFRNPWKACFYVVFKYYRWRILCSCFLILLILLVAVGLYAFPQYSVKRLLGA